MRASRAVRTGDLVVWSLALACGLAIGYVDSRPTWDDTGITVGALVVCAGILSLLRPRSWWIVGLAVGLPVPLWNYALHSSLDSAIAIVFALVAAGVGGGIGRLIGLGGATRPSDSAGRDPGGLP